MRVAQAGKYRLKLAYDYGSGLLKRVRDANGATVFWEAVSTDAWGHVQDEAFGNGVRSFTDFDQASGLMSARTGGVGGGSGLIHSLVDWDLNGNLRISRDAGPGFHAMPGHRFTASRAGVSGMPGQDFVAGPVG